jgi:hypothetical protein
VEKYVSRVLSNLSENYPYNGWVVCPAFDNKKAKVRKSWGTLKKTIRTANKCQSIKPKQMLLAFSAASIMAAQSFNLV